MYSTRPPVGIRNNNPFNIRKGPTAWQGLADIQADPNFCVFVAPEWGIRAGMKNFQTYQTKYGLRTVAQMIGRHAPPNENNTAAYIKAVNDALSPWVRPDHAVDLLKPEVSYALATAVILHENGQQPYTREVVLRGINLAGLLPTKA